MRRDWIEPTLLTLIIGLIYFMPIQTAKLPVFAGQFNNLDGSLYAVRLFDLLVSVLLILFASRSLTPNRLNMNFVVKRLLVLLGVFAFASLAEWGWDYLILLVFNLPTAVGEISDKMLLSPRRLNLSLSILNGNLLLIATGIFYGFILDYGRQIRQREKLEHENLEAEVKHLRSQINPHFLFNTLNNIFAITQRNDDDEGSDALLRLSGLMRYMLYESSGSKISLKQEIAHLQNYRDLMLLKYTTENPPQVNFQVEGQLESCQVAPLILLPFVENAFKHGIDNQGQGQIDVSLSLSSTELDFSVSNTRFPDRNASPEHKGIGLENVKQRLELIYPDKHQLEIKSTDERFEIRLRISL